MIMDSADQEEIRGIFKLPAELLLEILGRLVFPDILSVRQCCRALLELTCARALWVRRTTKFLEASPSPRRECTNMTAADMEAFERKHFTVSKHWRDAHPNFKSTRKIEVHEAVDRLCIVPGGRYLIIMPRRICTRVVDLDAPERPSEQVLFELVHEDGHHFTARNWRVGRDGLGSIFIIAEIAWPAVRGTFAFWEADFSTASPQAHCLGQTTIPPLIQLYRVHLNMIIYSLSNRNCLVIFDWRTLLLGTDKFRCGVVRYDSQISIATPYSLYVLKDNSVLIFDSLSRKFMYFLAPQFQPLESLHELQFSQEQTYPLWEYSYTSHNCRPNIFSLPGPSQSGHILFTLSRSTNCLSIIHVDRAGGTNVAHSTSEAPWDAFVLGRLRCLAMGWARDTGVCEFRCYTMEGQHGHCGDDFIHQPTPAAIEYHGSFTLKMGSEGTDVLVNNGHLIADSSGSGGVKPYFDEDSGRLCLLMSDITGRPWRRVVVIDFA